MSNTCHSVYVGHVTINGNADERRNPASLQKQSVLHLGQVEPRSYDIIVYAAFITS